MLKNDRRYFAMMGRSALRVHQVCKVDSAICASIIALSLCTAIGGDLHHKNHTHIDLLDP